MANDVWANNGIDPSDPAYSVISGTGSTAKKKTGSLEMKDFLKIMAAQMKNQSMSSSGTDNSQYITEMTLYSAIQAMNTMTSESNKQYASSLVGSDVILSSTDSSTGKKTLTQGTVQKACFSSTGDSYLLINDKVYDMSDVVEVLGYHDKSATQSGSGTNDSTSGTNSTTSSGSSTGSGTSGTSGGTGTAT